MKAFAKLATLPEPPESWLRIRGVSRYQFRWSLRDCQRGDLRVSYAYEQAVGHAPRNLEPGDPGYEQWTWNPRSRHARSIEEVAA